MSDHLLEIRQLLDELTAHLRALKESYSDDAESVARVEAIQEKARRGTELVERMKAAKTGL